MFKKFSLSELLEIKTNFLKDLKYIYTKKKYPSLSDFIKHYLKDLDEVYFLEGGDFIFKIEKKEDGYIFIDNKEKIILNLSNEELKKLHNVLKNKSTLSTSESKTEKSNKTILQLLFEKFRKGELNTINGKAFLVYDIETTGSTTNLKKTNFAIAYSVISSDNHQKSIKFRYINKKNLEKFVNFLIEFDGYIVGYNNIYFDNPVVIYNTLKEEKYVEIINQKSLDIFLFLWNLTGKRLGLNDVSKALVGVKKTLSSGKEGEMLLKQYEQTGDEDILEKVKIYCKNDVRMTLGIFLYFITNKKFFLDGKEYKYDLDTFLKLASTKREEKNKKDNKNTTKSLF